MKRKMSVVLSVGLTAVLLLAGIVVAGHSWRFDEQSRTIPVAEGGELEAVLTTPEHTRPVGLVVMVHGDGAVDATQGGLYAPWFEGAADAGWATLSWSKPGVGGSTGDWLAQSMADRAAEVEEVLDWARRQPDIPTSRIVLWGASQAGWVLPAVVAGREDIDGVVAVGTAINWLRQGRYNLEAELDHAGSPATERGVAERESARTDALLARNASYDEYRRTTHEPDPMSRSRWGFVSRNWRADATADLERAARRSTSWHLMAGRHDRNVDVTETARTYERVFGRRAGTTWFDAAHSMARPVMEDSDAVGFVTGVVWPRALLAPGVVRDYRQALERIAERRPH